MTHCTRQDTGKAMIGLDQAAVNERARLAPDRDVGVRDLLESFQPAQPGQTMSAQPGPGLPEIGQPGTGPGPVLNRAVQP
jgi:hypothetical protein